MFKNMNKNIIAMAEPVKLHREFSKIQMPGVAVDVVLFAIINNELKVALIKREEDPYFSKHALPGRFVRYEEKIEDTARKALETKGNISASNIFLEQLYTFGQNLERDTRIRTISIVYYALIDSAEITKQAGNKFIWESVYKLPSLAFDHEKIIKYALERLRDKLFASDFVAALMPSEFTLSELQNAYEIILSKQLDKRNFRKKIFEIGILKMQKLKRIGSHRPAQLYSIKKKAAVSVEN